MLLSKLLRGLVLHRGAVSLLGVALAWTFHAQAYADISQCPGRLATQALASAEIEIGSR